MYKYTFMLWENNINYKEHLFVYFYVVIKLKQVNIYVYMYIDL